MSFLELIGAIIVFGALFMYFPRVSFVVVLVIVLGNSNPGVYEGAWGTTALVLAVIAIIIGVVFEGVGVGATHRRWFNK